MTPPPPSSIPGSVLTRAWERFQENESEENADAILMAIPSSFRRVVQGSETGSVSAVMLCLEQCDFDMQKAEKLYRENNHKFYLMNYEGMN